MSDDTFDVKQLGKDVADVAKGFEVYKETNDAILKEMSEKGAVDPLLEEKLVKIEASMTKSQERLDAYELSQKRQARVITDPDGNSVDMDAKALHWAQDIAKKRGTMINEFGADKLDEYKAAFESYMRGDERKMNAEEFKSLSVGSDPDGGYRVHPDMSGRVVSKVFESSPMRAFASIQTISTDALEGVFDLDEAASGWVGETAARPETDTPQIGVWRIPVHELYANPSATQKILDDAEINMEQWLANKVSEKFARDEATAFTTGDGISKPRGFLTYPDGSTLPGQIEQFETGVNGDFAAAPNGGDALIDMVYGLKMPYRNNGTWFMNRATTGKTRKLKDSDGAYLWQPGVQAGQPATLLGYPVASFEDMPDPATGSLSIAFGDMRETYQIVDRIGIRTLRDPYSNKPFVQFYTTKRVGGDVTNFEAMKILAFEA